ncbi:exported hypothetical protein [Desulfosarcina cetonica]|uniref:hypothetical protein n=1 Tax=Desulfosarcina cetonica TaxID=90730 RepID=UPI0006D0177B|nr:hypothetical protein [Desulfosarcina cetonica]VTR67448.1 exported hypothetical protein [Desulfosarcina cetonica]
MFSKKWILPLIALTACVTFFGVANPAFADSRHHRKPSPADCDAYARNYARNYSPGMLGGAARGGAGGALFGAVIGGRKGAKRGAMLGGAIGGTTSAVNREEIRRRAYHDCMSGRVRW